MKFDPMMVSTILVIILLVVGIIFILHFKHGLDVKMEICQDAGFDVADLNGNAEEGYVKCCKSIYENHIVSGEICDGVKK